MTRLILIAFTIFAVNIAAANERANLVLFPIEVDEANIELEDEYGTALQQGLQSRYTVYYGPAVEKELEKEYAKFNCTAEECSQNVAIAFNGELTADASATQVGNGYALKLVIRNIITDELVESRTEICRACDGLTLIERFKQLGRGEGTPKNSAVTVQSNVLSADTIVIQNVGDSSSEGSPAILLFDSVPSGAAVAINGKAAGTTPYQGLNHTVGEQLNIELTSDGFEPLSFHANLNSALVRVQKPFELQKVQAKILIASNPPVTGASLLIDNQVLGELPYSLTIDYGTYLMAIKYRNLNIELGEVALKAGVNSALLLDVKTLAEEGAKDDDRRYVISHDGSEVTDIYSGLVWKRCSEGQIWDGIKCNGDLIEFSRKELLGYYQETTSRLWRLPSKQELESLVYCSLGPVKYPSDGAACLKQSKIPAIASLFDSSMTFKGNFWYVGSKKSDSEFGDLDFVTGSSQGHYPYGNYFVRLVRNVKLFVTDN